MLGGELHPGRAQVERRQQVAAEGAHPAVGVADAGPEEEVEQPREQRVADVPVKPGHRARLDPGHPVADHQVGAVAQRPDEAVDLGEVVGVVGVAHEDVLALGPRRSPA